MSGGMIQEKGRRMIKDVSALVPEAEKITLEFNAEWLWNFQRCWNLKSRKMHGEAPDANARSIEEALRHLYEVCNGYSAGDIFKGDESGCNYAM